MKVLIIGGYGRFGGNLAKLLSDCEGLTLLIAGRNLAKAKQFCAAYQGIAEARPLTCDRNDIAPVLEKEKPDLVVDASGPFQTYGNNPYHVAKACIAVGIHYFDLADSAGFVANIGELNKDAKKARVTVLSGVSTCPALSGAVVRDLAQGMTVTDITLGIAPTPKADLGLSVIKGILSYTGTKIPTVKDGKQTHFIGLAESRRYQIAPDNYPPLEERRFSAVEAPELIIFPKLYPRLQNIWVGAGTRPEFLLRLLNGLAIMKARFNLPNLTLLAKLVHRVMSLCKFGPHRGGMFVEVTGEVDGQSITRAWHLIAEGNDGPLIPAIAAETLVRKMLAGKKLETGAGSAEAELTLAEFEARFARHQIVSTIRRKDES